MNMFDYDKSIIDHINSIDSGEVSTDARARKVVQLTADPRLLLNRNMLQNQERWVHSMALIHRNAPDHRGLTITTLPNCDAEAALLAIRLGVPEHLAVALAYADLIESVPMTDGCFHSVMTQDELVALATFQCKGDSASQVALLANTKVRDFKFMHKPEECILLHDHQEDGLVWGLPGFDRMADVLDYRTDEPLYFELEKTR